MIDTHTHIYCEEFEEDRTGVVHRALEVGVTTLLLPNIDESSWEPMLQLCNAHPGVCFPMLGLHPTDLPKNPKPLLDRMEHADAWNYEQRAKQIAWKKRMDAYRKKLEEQKASAAAADGEFCAIGQEGSDV